MTDYDHRMWPNPLVHVDENDLKDLVEE